MRNCFQIPSRHGVMFICIIDEIPYDLDPPPTESQRYPRKHRQATSSIVLEECSSHHMDVSITYNKSPTILGSILRHFIFGNSLLQIPVQI